MTATLNARLYAVLHGRDCTTHVAAKAAANDVENAVNEWQLDLAGKQMIADAEKLIDDKLTDPNHVNGSMLQGG